MQAVTQESLTLGATGLRVGAVGVGTNRWGSGAVADARATFDALLDAGVTLIDTAEIYAGGASERTVGRCIHESGRKPLVLTKFFPFPWRLGRRAMRAALRASLQRLQLPRVDVYLLHFPWPPVRASPCGRKRSRSSSRARNLPSGSSLDLAYPA